MQYVLVLKSVVCHPLVLQRTLCSISVPCAGHGRLMTPSSPAVDRLRLAQNGDCARAVRTGALDDSAHRLGGRMRCTEDGENRPPNTAKRSQSQKKRYHGPACYWSGQVEGVSQRPGSISGFSNLLSRAPSQAQGREVPLQEDTVHGKAERSSGSEDEEAQPTQPAKRQRTHPSMQGPSQFTGSQRHRRTFPQACLDLEIAVKGVITFNSLSEGRSGKQRGNCKYRGKACCLTQGEDRHHT